MTLNEKCIFTRIICVTVSSLIKILIKKEDTRLLLHGQEFFHKTKAKAKLVFRVETKANTYIFVLGDTHSQGNLAWTTRLQFNEDFHRVHRNN